MHHLVGTGLCCAPPTCVVHHQPAFNGDVCPSDEGVASTFFCTDVRFGSAQLSFVPIMWCTRRYCMFVNFFDGVQCYVVSLGVGTQTDTNGKTE